MKPPALPANEEARLRALRRYAILDTVAEASFDGLTTLAAHIASVPIALVSLVDADRQWFKSCYGLDVRETPRAVSFCGHAVAEERTLYVPNALEDVRFADNPLVLGGPEIRFYFGVPLRTHDGFVLGTLCVIDRVPRELTAEQQTMLTLLAEQVVAQIELRRQHDLLEEHHANQAVLLDALPGLYFHLDADGVLLNVHGAMRGDLFAEPAAFLGRAVGEVLPPEVAEAIVGAITRAQAEGAQQAVRYALDFPNQPKQHFEARIGARADGTSVAFVQNTTQEVLAAQRLRAQADLLASIVRAQSNFLSEADPQATFEGLLNDLLAATESAFGFVGDVLHDPDGRPSLEIRAMTHGAEIAAATSDADVRSFLSEHAPVGMRFDNLQTLFGAALTSEKPVIANHPAGDERASGVPQGHPPLASFVALPLHVGGMMVGLVGLANRPGGYDEASIETLRPLTATAARLLDLLHTQRERTAAIESLRENERRFRAIIDTATEVIITVDEAGRIQTVNPAVEPYFGYTPEELVGQPLRMLLPPDDWERHAASFASLLRTGSSERATVGAVQEVLLRRKSGEIFPAELAVSDFEWQGHRYLTGAVRDISERKRIEQLQADFVSTVSHELRTPLTSIRGSLSLVANGVLGELPPRAKEYVDIALSNGERLVRLVSDILDFQKMRAGRIEMRFEAYPLRDLVDEALRTNDGFAQAHGVRLVVEGERPACLARVDRDRFLQVLSNLLSNAVKFSPRGSDVVIDLSAHEDRCLVGVRDYGPGVGEDFRERLFEPFAQADASSTRRQGGTGLGLSISRALVAEMGGTLVYEPAEGGGSRFVVDLPAVGA